MPSRIFEDSDDEGSGPVVQNLAEVSAETFKSPAAPKPLVVELLPNSNRLAYVPEALHRATKLPVGVIIADLESAEKLRTSAYGLNKPVPHTSGGQWRKNVANDATTNAEPENLTDEQLALNELINPGHQPGRDLIIARCRGNDLFSNINVTQDQSSLEDYEAVPVEAFGLAMLRGMGYDPDKEAKNDKLKEQPRRPDLLGIGASERPEDTKTAEEAAKKKFQKRREERNFDLVRKMNKRTGEVIKETPEMGATSFKKNDEEKDRLADRSGAFREKPEYVPLQDYDTRRGPQRSLYASDRDYRDRDREREREKPRERDPTRENGHRHRYRSRSPCTDHRRYTEDSYTSERHGEKRRDTHRDRRREDDYTRYRARR